MTKDYVDHEVLRQAAADIIEGYKEMGKSFSPEEEAQFADFITGLVDAAPPTDEQVWETIELLRNAIEVRNRDNALQAVTLFMLQFISGCEHSPEAFQLLPRLREVREAIRAEHFREARELLMTFMSKAQEVARSM